MKARSVICAALLGGTAWFPATAQSSASPVAPSPPAAQAAAGRTARDDQNVGDIVVTARRREERLQTVPVSISAFSGATLTRSNVQTIGDVRNITPGLTFNSDGGKSDTALSLRGIGRIPLGEVQPGVVSYFANVPLPATGSNIPIYDIANVQVLKGPQGTLFGRNALGGAVLIAPQAPTGELGGYVEGSYGNYDYKEIQGAIEAPIVKDVLSIRVAGQVRRRDPLIYSINGDGGFNNVHENSGRVSVLFTPTDWLKSTTVFDYFKANENAQGEYLLRQNFSFSALFAPALGPVAGGLIGGALDQQVAGYLAGQHKNFYGSYTDSSGHGQADRRALGVSNDTSATFGAFTLRNIFGYRKNKSEQLINTAGVGPTVLPGAIFASPVDIPFTIFQASALIDRQYMTDEVQFLGTFDRFNFIVGGFYNNDKPSGAEGSRFNAFTTAGTAVPYITAHVRNKNYALFAQGTYKLTDTLSATGGFRYSWDKVTSCGGSVFATGYATDSECREAAAAGSATDGIGVVNNSGSAPSWTLGLDLKATPNLLLYVTSRRGYRAANVNTPLFETPFTTGGTNPGCGFGSGVCVDLRPYQKTGKETLTDVEIGEKWAFQIGGARGTINTALFYSKYKNALQFLNVQAIIPTTAPDSPTNASLGVNVADLSIYGAELSASVSPSRNLTISFNGAYTHERIDSISLPPVTGISFDKNSVTKFSPSFAGTASASWTLPFHPLDGDLILNGDVYMTDKFGGQYGENLPGYQLVNMRLDWKGIGGTRIDLGAFVSNLTKEHYFLSSGVLLPSFPLSTVTVGDPRTYGVSARMAF